MQLLFLHPIFFSLYIVVLQIVQTMVSSFLIIKYKTESAIVDLIGVECTNTETTSSAMKDSPLLDWTMEHNPC